MERRYKLAINEFSHIIDIQRNEFFKTLGVKERDGEFNIKYVDKNYSCMPYLEAALNSNVHGLSFFSGGGGLDIGAQIWHKSTNQLGLRKRCYRNLKDESFLCTYKA